MLVVICRRPCLRPLLLLLPLSAVMTCAAHLPFSHHNLLPSMNRKHGKAMPFKAVEVPMGSTPEDAAARPDYCLAHQAPIAAFEFPSGVVLYFLFICFGVDGGLILVCEVPLHLLCSCQPGRRSPLTQSLAPLLPCCPTLPPSPSTSCNASLLTPHP